MSKMDDLTRRDFLKAAMAAGVLLTIPAPLQRAFAATGVKQPINDMMIARLAEKTITDPVTFIFCADLHIPFDDRGVFKTIIKRANELAVSFVLFGGDCVQVGNSANFNILVNLLKKFNMPVISAIGNHDTSFSDYKDEKEWTSRFGSSHFKFDAGPVRVIALDNAAFDMREEDYVFLEESLKTDLRKFVVMHRPTDYLIPEYTTPLNDKPGRFRKLVENGKVTAVLMGHEHHYGNYMVNGVRYIVSGGAGGKLNTNTINNFHHFMIIKAGKDTFDYQVEKI